MTKWRKETISLPNHRNNSVVEVEGYGSAYFHIRKRGFQWVVTHKPSLLAISLLSGRKLADVKRRCAAAEGKYDWRANSATEIAALNELTPCEFADAIRKLA